MNYNFDFAVSATISSKVVEEMIKKVVEEQTGKKVARIEMKVQSVTKGFQRDEYTETAFNGCTVYFENEKSASDQKGFVRESYQR